MREIKFNVFNNNTGKIIKAEDCEIRFYGYGIYRVYVNNEEVCNDKSSKLLQWTGLEDKNGKEIYEGDIVKFQDWKNKEVVFGSEHFAGFTLKGTDLFLTDYDAKEMEVIGNIFENKDLLSV